MSDPEARPDAGGELALDDYDSKASVVLTDDERWPGLTTSGRARLDEIRFSAKAPSWQHEAGHRLDRTGIAASRIPLLTAGWLDAHLAVARALPAYRDYAGVLGGLGDFPFITRDDLLHDIGGFVPLDADLSRITQGTSSGSTGRALLIPELPDDIARTFWMLTELIAAEGVDWQPDPRRLALVNVVNQRRAYTYASAVPGFGESVMARINLHSDAWGRSPRSEFLAEFDPQVISGSPSSLAALLDDDLVGILHPLALVSGATHLTPGLRAALTAAFACPVLDIYGLHETRPIGVSVDGGPFVILNRRLAVEIIDARGEPVVDGGRGEIVVTAGENTVLPLVRYRTGDFGRLVELDGRLAIADLEGREEVTFIGVAGEAIPAVELTQQLQAAGAHGWTVEQDASNHVTAIVVGGDHERIRSRLTHVFGADTVVHSAAALGELGDGKPQRYRRAGEHAATNVGRFP